MNQQEYLSKMETWADGERMVVEAFVGGLENVNNHFAHWEDVASRIKEGDRVIEVGCGCGMSSRIYSLASKTEFVAIDKPEVVEMSSVLYKTPGVTFYGEDFNTQWSDKYETFDIVICVDVIEHVENKDKFLRNLLDLGHCNTTWILSTPINDWDDDNKYHLHHWNTIEEFMEDIGRILPIERVVRI